LVKDWMSKVVFSIDADASLQKAIKLQKECKVNMLPVIRDGKIVGVINRSDALRVLMSLTGGDKKGYMFAFSVKDKPGNVGKIAGTMREFGGRVASILGSYEKAPSNYRNVYVRVYDLEPEKYIELLEQLKETVDIHYVVDFVHHKREIFEK